MHKKLKLLSSLIKSAVDDKNNWKSDFLSISKWNITEEEIKIPSWKEF
jgi:hypothetical protein